MKNIARTVGLLTVVGMTTSCGLIGGEEEKKEQPGVGATQTIEAKSNGVKYEITLDKVEDVTGSVPEKELPDSAKSGSIFYVHYTVKRPDASQKMASEVGSWTGTAKNKDVKVRFVRTILGDYAGCDSLTSRTSKDEKALEYKACAPLVTETKDTLTEVATDAPTGIYMKKKNEERRGTWWTVTPVKATAPSSSN